MDGETETIRMHGGKEPTAEDRAAMSCLVSVVRERVEVEGESVRHRTLTVLRAHWPSDGTCRCGRESGGWATLWAAHMAKMLAEAGVLLPLDQRMADQP